MTKIYVCEAYKGGKATGRTVEVVVKDKAEASSEASKQFHENKIQHNCVICETKSSILFNQRLNSFFKKTLG